MPVRVAGGIFGSQVSDIGYLVQVSRFGCRSRVPYPCPKAWTRLLAA